MGHWGWFRHPQTAGLGVAKPPHHIFLIFSFLFKKKNVMKAFWE
jgi:hypothetical protein